MRAGSHLRWAAVLLLAALAACARSAPPAPVVAGSGQAAARAAHAPQPAVPHPDQVVVQPGETLYSVSRRYAVPVRSLIEANNLSPPYGLTAGRKLVVPQVRQHIVEAGETLYSISRLYGVDTSTLARSNGLEAPYRVRVGQALVLPAPVEAAHAPVIQATAPAASYAAPAAAPDSTPPAEAPPAVVAKAEPPPAAPSPPEAKPREEPAPAAAPAPAEAGVAGAAPSPPEEKPVPPPAAGEKLAALPPPPAAAPREGSRSFVWPVHGRILSSYGNGEGGTHNDGINIAAAEGTPVVAADAGVVAYAGNELRGYGNLVLIKHADGWMTAYAHTSALLVKRGEKVRRGQTIAKVGATGAVGTPQLHFEIRHGTRALDPGDYLPPEASSAARS